jgi:bisanhydrobacterioruberin hydratase
MNWSRKYWFSAIIMVLFHLVGWIGMNTGVHTFFFEHLSWANLLLSFILLLWCHESVAEYFRLIVFVFVVFLIGMVVEIVGVRTGNIFGAYHYTSVLGPGILGVPLIIGVNWAMLTYTSAVISSLIPTPKWARVVSGALIMVICDVLLESFAIRHHFWVWEGTAGPPLTNFIGWLFVSSISNIIFVKLIPDTRNKLASFYLLVFFIFLIADKLI